MKLILTVCMICFCQVSFCQSNVEKIDNNTLIRLLEDGDIQLLDVRTPGEVAKGYIKGAVRINYFDKDFADRLSALDKEKPIIVYCAAGGRSAKSGEKLKALGFKKIYDLSGGFSAYQKEGFPVYKDQ